MKSYLQTAVRAMIALTIGASLGLASMPSMADKPEKPGKSGNAGKPDKDHKGHGGPGHGGPNHGGGDVSDILAAGATAAVLTQMLGLQPQAYAVGAKPLPPGIQKNLARGKPLPPGLARESVPPTVLSGLPRVDGAEWARVGTELILIDVTSQVIRQVVNDVFR